MKDIAINFDNNTCLVQDNDLVLINDIDRIKQQIRLAIYTMKGDWTLNPDAGIDYKNGFQNNALLQSDIETAIRSIDGIQRIDKLEMTRQRTNINFKITVIIDNETITINEVINVS